MSGTRPAAERLGQAEKMRLIASLKATGPASVLANRVSALAEPVPDARTDFTQHPLFVQTETQLAALSALGIANPFLAQHEGRAGARTRIEGRELINFASYDYLGLNGDPRIAEAAETAIRASGTSVSASRMVAGERDLTILFLDATDEALLRRFIIV